MALVEKQISDALVSRLAELELMGAQVTADLSQAAFGKVKNDEDAASDAVIHVAVPPRSYDTAQIPVANITPTISLSVRADTDPTGAKLISLYDSVATLLQSWQDDLNAAFAAFDTDNFTPAGFRLDGGAGPEVDDSASKWVVSFTFTIRGVIN